jgi:hypothetical protein
MSSSERSSIGDDGIRTYGQQSALRVQIARAIAQELGDDFDKAHPDKSAWIADRGGDPFRDINLPFKHDYMAAAERVMGICYAASVDTRPKGGDATEIAAPFTGGAVDAPASRRPTLPPQEPNI